MDVYDVSGELRGSAPGWDVGGFVEDGDDDAGGLDGVAEPVAAFLDPALAVARHGGVGARRSETGEGSLFDPGLGTLNRQNEVTDRLRTRFGFVMGLEAADVSGRIRA